jgi:hypothetical protein
VTRREAWLSAGGLFLLALVIRALIASTIPFPTPEDTAYYYGVARNVVEGRGLVSDAIWSYGTPPLVFPRPAFEVWLPLPTLLAIIPMAILGTDFHAAQVAVVILGSLVPVLAWRLAADLAVELELPVGRARTLAVGSGVTAAVSLPLLLHGVLPDSTTPYTVFSLAACLLMVRVIRELGGAQALDRRLLGLGVLFGLAALTRNEVVWLGLTWVAVAWWGARRMSPSWRSTLVRLVGVPAVVGLAILSPWLVRDWIVFGSPLPGQAATNALSITGFDIFAYADPPTLSRYLAQGPAFMVSSRVDGFIHNLFSVLLVPSFPVGLVGLVSLVVVQRVGTARSLRPLVLLSVLTFTATTLLFPVATTWGTFLHASGPIQVLLIVGCLAGLDAFIVRVGVVRGWTKPVAWLGPTLTVATSVLFSFAILGYAQQSRDVQERYAALGPALTAAGLSQAEIDAPVIADFPIWYAEGMRHSSLALPDEPPSDVISLAQRFGARLLVLSADGHGRWPAVIDAGPTGAGGPAAACFHEVHLTPPTDPAARDALSGTRVFRIACS